MLKEYPPGALFPSERELVEILGVSRKTLRMVLRPFVLQGILEQTRKGTVVRRRQETGFDGMHPFNMGMFAERQVLKICLYENLSAQKKYWSHVRDAFSHKQGGARIEFDFLSHEISTVDAYRKHIEATRPDLIQISGSPWHSILCEKFASSIPADIKAIQKSEVLPCVTINLP